MDAWQERPGCRSKGELTEQCVTYDHSDDEDTAYLGTLLYLLSD